MNTKMSDNQELCEVSSEEFFNILSNIDKEGRMDIMPTIVSGWSEEIGYI